MDQISEYNELFPPEILGMFLGGSTSGSGEHGSLDPSVNVRNAPNTGLTATYHQFQSLGPINIGLATATSTMQVIQEEPLRNRVRRRSSSSMPSKLHRGSSCETCLSAEAAAGHCKKERRRQQNRVSQQKFREKKEARLREACEEISELQASVDSLRSEKKDLHITNKALRLRIEELERSQSQVTSPRDPVSASDIACSPHQIQAKFAGRMVMQKLMGEKSSGWAATSVYSDLTVDMSQDSTNISGSLDPWFDPDEVLEPLSIPDGAEEFCQTKC